MIYLFIYLFIYLLVSITEGLRDGDTESRAKIVNHYISKLLVNYQLLVNY